MSAQKKSFKGNPALNFITTTEKEEQLEHEDSFIDTDAILKRIETPPTGYKIDPRFVETKSRRLQLVLQPSLYERVKKAAKDEGLSVNEYVHQILDSATHDV